MCVKDIRRVCARARVCICVRACVFVCRCARVGKRKASVVCVAALVTMFRVSIIARHMSPTGGRSVLYPTYRHVYHKF